MKNMLPILLPVIFTIIISCNDTTKHSHFTDKFTSNRNGLIKETFDSSGNISTRRYFTNDTVPNGPFITYYSNGQINSWTWYQKYQKNPYCGAFYNIDKSLKKFKGNGILDSIYGAKYFDLGLVCPPNLKCFIKINDVYNNKIIDKYYVLPTVFSDTLNWVTVDLGFKKGHTYKAFFGVIDSNHTRFDNLDSVEVKNPYY